MSNFPLTRLEVISSKDEDDVVYGILKKIYSGKIYFDMAELDFKGLLIWKSQKYMGTGSKFVTTYEIREYQ